MFPGAQYLLLGLIVFLFNLLPAFTPPTWILLSAYALRYNLIVFPAVLIGALAATLGRVCLALITRKYVRPFLSDSSRENAAALGHYLNTNKKITVSLILTYAFLPFPSNQIFIAAGLAKVDLRIIGYSFFVGRLISYSFWIAASHLIAISIFPILDKETGRLISILFEILGFVMIIFLIRFDWSKHVLKQVKAFENKV